ncbi:uncharacterized protein LOC117116552 [Anneissia japonica]|uniref:uncharacterized protein LOC117116552 n=1 Tax=Anneissia japonica TaxID=1529436 RepID=UPI00142552B0|nr:uncharacterized protein LOC117116552 [Anneissia japonica]
MDAFVCVQTLVTFIMDTVWGNVCPLQQQGVIILSYLKRVPSTNSSHSSSGRCFKGRTMNQNTDLVPQRILMWELDGQMARMEKAIQDRLGQQHKPGSLTVSYDWLTDDFSNRKKYRIHPDNRLQIENLCSLIHPNYVDRVTRRFRDVIRREPSLHELPGLFKACLKYVLSVQKIEKQKSEISFWMKQHRSVGSMSTGKNSRVVSIQDTNLQDELFSAKERKSVRFSMKKTRSESHRSVFDDVLVFTNEQYMPGLLTKCHSSSSRTDNLCRADNLPLTLETDVSVASILRKQSTPTSVKEAWSEELDPSTDDALHSDIKRRKHPDKYVISRRPKSGKPMNDVTLEEIENL